MMTSPAASKPADTGVSTSRDHAAESRHLPTTFVFELTQHCNNRCGYCYNAWRAPDLAYPRIGAKEMSIRQIERE